MTLPSIDFFTMIRALGSTHKSRGIKIAELLVDPEMNQSKGGSFNDPQEMFAKSQKDQDVLFRVASE